MIVPIRPVVILESSFLFCSDTAQIAPVLDFVEGNSVELIFPHLRWRTDAVRTALGRAAAFVCAALACALIGLPLRAAAGPPFITDDPEPVEYHHWEVYLASQYSHNSDGVTATAPHVEVNYGVRPNVQLHLIAPLVYSRATGMPSQYGFGDMEFGVKYRFIQETAKRPQVGIFPLIEAPTGDSSRGLGNGQAQFFLPVWLQKSWGKWSSYGGGGYWVNPGTGNRNYWLTGWQLQRSLSKQLALGAEIFYSTPSTVGSGDRTGFNIGAIYDFDEGDHLLFSAGTDIHGPNHGSIYLAHQWTFGPKEAENKGR